jgi:hypothetical protein
MSASESPKAGLWSTRKSAAIVSAKDWHRREYERFERLGIRRPPRGKLVVPASDRPHFYARIYVVAPVAETALSCLGQVLAAAHGDEVLPLAASWYAEGNRELGRWCLKVGDKLAAESPAPLIGFVSQFGPLVRDFGEWCHAQERDRQIWPSAWPAWARSAFLVVALQRKAQPVPAPAGFYVWASLMLAAVREHPGWEGSRAFLGERLASITMAFDSSVRSRVAQGEVAEILQTPMYAQGQLLDYLALSAAFGRGLASRRMRKCIVCEKQFTATRSFRKYCSPRCQAFGPSIWTERWRERKRK